MAEVDAVLRDDAVRLSAVGRLHREVPMADQNVVLRCQNGDRDAFRHLVEQYQDVLLGTAYAMTGNRAISEEFVQEAFLSAWKGIRRFERERPFKPWIIRILVNAILSDRLRRRFDTVPLDDADPIDDQEGPEMLAVAEWEHRSVQQAMRSLSVDHRETIILRYFTDLTVPQVAQALNLQEGTVKSRLHRALRALRDSLLDSEATDERT